jgi:hypothetical protein
MPNSKFKANAVPKTAHKILIMLYRNGDAITQEFEQA